jgi:hypothetical protein
VLNPQKALAMKAYELLGMLNLNKRENVYLIILEVNPGIDSFLKKLSNVYDLSKKLSD